MSNKKHINRIIAVDLDETLLNSNHKISERTIKALANCKNNGCKIVISSARGYGTCKNFAKQISADFICCHAGNMIVDATGEILYSNPLTKTDSTALIDNFSKYTNNFIVDSKNNLWGGIDDVFCRSWGIIYCDLNKLKTIEAYKIFIYFNDSYRKEIEDYCAARRFVCHEMRGAPYMFVTPAKSDKFYALEQLLKILDVKLENLVVFGDDFSDLLSIQKAGIGVAVSNAKKEVFESAKFKTLSNDEDGVAVFLEEHFKFDNVNNNHI